VRFEKTIFENIKIVYFDEEYFNSTSFWIINDFVKLVIFEDALFIFSFWIQYFNKLLLYRTEFPKDIYFMRVLPNEFGSIIRVSITILIKGIFEGLQGKFEMQEPVNRKVRDGKIRLGFLKLVIPIVIFLLLMSGYFTLSYGLQKFVNRRISIAIIPFHNRTNDTSLDSYGFGMASEIRTQLSISGQFDFISSDQATIKYRNSILSPKEIARELNVDYLLIGNFYQLGDQLKITTELSKASTNMSLWSLPIELKSVQSVKQLFEIQEKIIKKVMAWFSFSGQMAAKLPTKNLAAYQYFLEAKELWQKKLPEAQEQFEKAINLDSNFLSAYVGLFKVMDENLWKSGNDKTIRESELKTLLDRIIKLSPHSWETYLVRGIYYYHGLKRYDQGLEFLMKSISINPEGEDALSYVGAMHRRKLNHNEALKFTLKSIDIDPQRADNWNELALILKDNGNLKAALRSELIAMKKGLKPNWNYSLIAYFALEDGTLSQIPKEIQEFYGIHFYRNLAKEQRDWQKLITIADTAKVTKNYTNFVKNLDKAFAYYFLKTPIFACPGCSGPINLGLAKVYATLAQKEEGNKTFFSNMFYAEDIFFLLGEQGKGLDLLNERTQNLRNNSHNGQDISRICSGEIDRIIILAFGGKYDEATEALKELNKQYPEWGNYRLLYTDFRMDNIKKYYPPFNEALSGLKLPVRIEFPEKFKNM
jgi:TolB-like protein